MTESIKSRIAHFGDQQKALQKLAPVQKKYGLEDVGNNGTYFLKDYNFLASALKLPSTSELFQVSKVSFIKGREKKNYVPFFRNNFLSTDNMNFLWYGFTVPLI